MEPKGGGVKTNPPIPQPPLHVEGITRPSTWEGGGGRLRVRRQI